MTQSTLTLIIDGRSHAIAAQESIAKLITTWNPKHRLILLVKDSVQVSFSASCFESLEIIWVSSQDSHSLKRVFEAIASSSVGYIPTGIVPSLSIPQPPTEPHLLSWIPSVTFPPETATQGTNSASAWMISMSLFRQIQHQLYQDDDYSFLNLAHLLEAAGINVFYYCESSLSDSEINTTKKIFSTADRVLAVVPHYGCEQWLSQCLRSLLNQTRPPDNIVVIDDQSAVPPIDIVHQFPEITLLAAPVRSGPYRLIQQVIEDTDYDAYLFQDADDWSSCDRLEKLLVAMNATECEMVGTQELRVLESELLPICYPLDVNQALAVKPGHGLLHPTSLVRRDLVMRLGGFATGLKFGGDTEFLLRAIFVARVINIPDFAYFRRKRPGSLTTAPDTGLDSPVRQRLIQQCKARALENYAAKQAGQPLCLNPLLQESSILLHHLSGPKLSPLWR